MNMHDALKERKQSTDDRPFYELDDDEAVIAEATQAALSPSTLPQPKPLVLADPGVVLCSALDEPTYQRLHSLAEYTRKFTIIDHAQLINSCACTLDRQGQDRYGLAALLRHESSLLQLDRLAPGSTPRSLTGLNPAAAVDLLSKSSPTDRAPAPEGLSLRLTAGAILALMHISEESNSFFILRRLGLALLPTLTRRDIAADALKEYTFTLRIFINALAARWTLMTWSELRNYHAEDADLAARKLIKALRLELEAHQ